MAMDSFVVVEVGSVVLELVCGATVELADSSPLASTHETKAISQTKDNRANCLSRAFLFAYIILHPETG